MWVDEGVREGYRHLLLDFRESHLLIVSRIPWGVVRGVGSTEPFVSLKRLRLKMQMVLRG